MIEVRQLAPLSPQIPAQNVVPDLLLLAPDSIIKSNIFFIDLHGRHKYHGIRTLELGHQQVVTWV